MNTTACVISAGGKLVKRMETESNANGLVAVCDFMKNDAYCVMMESSTYAYQVYRFFDDKGIEAHVVHAKGLKMITDTDKKTDKKDAETIGKILRLWKKKEIDLSMSYIPSRDECELKDICRYREEITVKIGDESRRIHSHMDRNLQFLPEGVSNIETKKSRAYIRATWPNDITLLKRLAMYEGLLTERTDVAKNIGSRMKDDENVRLLAEIPGIGKQTAVQIMSMIIDIRRFPDPEKLCAYFGLVPRVRDSGGKEHHGKMTKNGDKMMRMIMERVTLSHMRSCDSSITAYFNRKRGEMGQKKALITASRKMLTVIHAVLTSKKRFAA